MKKLILLPLVAILALTVSCERDSIVTPEPPTVGIWDEIVLIRLHNNIEDPNDTTTSVTFMTWEGLLANANRVVNLEDLVLFVRKVEFLPGGNTMQITTRFLEPNLDLDGCGETENGVVFRQEFMEIEYTITSSHWENMGVMLVQSGQFTGPAFDQANIDSCSPTGDVTGIHFRFSYQQDNRRTMMFYEVGNPDDPSFYSSHFLRFRQ